MRLRKHMDVRSGTQREEGGGASFNPLLGSKFSAKDAQTSEDTVMRTLIVLFISLLAGCSKSPMDATLDGANSAATKLIAPLVQKDASH
jgi:hypothetical protein